MYYSRYSVLKKTNFPFKLAANDLLFKLGGGKISKRFLFEVSITTV